MNTRRIVLDGVLTALFCALAPLSIPLAGGIPISLATLVVMLLGFLLGEKDGTICVLIYIFIGAIGIPVFSSYRSGLDVLFGITGGYIFGYVALAYLCGLFERISNKYEIKKKIGFEILGMLVGTFVLYLIGTIWFMKYTGNGLMASLTMCVIPFLPGDILKMIVVIILNNRLKKLNLVKDK